MCAHLHVCEERRGKRAEGKSKEWEEGMGELGSGEQEQEKEPECV